MMEFGKSLRTARESKGYTILQLAETTHLAPSVVENLENEDFSRIAAPIYGRGFVKLYCEAVGLAPKPFVDEFMNIVNGDHEPRIRERSTAPEEPPTPEERSAVPEEEPPAALEEPPAPEVKAVPAYEPAPEPIVEPPPQQDLFNTNTLVAEEADNEPALSRSRYASPFRTAQGVSTQRIWRTGVLALVALAVIILLLFGLKALHRATSSAPAPAEDTTTRTAAAPSAQKQKPAAAKPAEPRKAQNIPSLYID